MSETRLAQLERLVDELTPQEQARLLEYLAPRIAWAVAAGAPASATADANGWQEFFRLGDALCAESPPGSPTLTAALFAMRR